MPEVLIKHHDFQLTADIKPNDRGDPTLVFSSVWPTSNKQEPVTSYSVTLPAEGRRSLALLLLNGGDS